MHSQEAVTALHRSRCLLGFDWPWPSFLYATSEITETILNSKAPSKRCLYALNWGYFLHSEFEGWKPVHVPGGSVLDFFKSVSLWVQLQRHLRYMWLQLLLRMCFRWCFCEEVICFLLYAWVETAMVFPLWTCHFRGFISVFGMFNRFSALRADKPAVIS